MTQVMECDQETFEEAKATLNAMFEEYVPAVGAADSVGGEIVRAISRLYYRFYNDGDRVRIGYGKVTCNAAWRFLLINITAFEPDLDNVPMLNAVIGLGNLNARDWEYKGDLQRILMGAADYLKAHPERFEEPLKGLARMGGYDAFFNEEEDRDDEDEDDVFDECDW